MVGSPKVGAFDPNRALLDRIAILESAVKNLTNKTLFSVSVGSGGVTVNGGSIIIQNSGGIQLPLGGSITDQSGNILFSADRANGGRLSTPYIAVPLYPQFTSRSTGGTGTPTLLNSDLFGSEHVVYTGQIPQITHSGIHWDFTAGYASGAGTVTTRFYVNGTLMDSFSATSGAGAVDHSGTVYAPYVAATVFGSASVGIQVTMQTSVSDSSQVWLQPNGFAQVGQ